MKMEREVVVGPHALRGLLSVPARASGLVIFAHGSGSSRFSPRNTCVAEALQKRGFATLLFDLLTDDEGADRANVFNIELLAGRVCEAIEWVHREPRLTRLPIGLFGASTGAGAAIVAAASAPGRIAAVVSRGGRPDLAGAALEHLRAPTLLIVGADDRDVAALNEAARQRMRCKCDLVVIPGATHLFEEPGALDLVIERATDWFKTHLKEARHADRAVS